MLDTEEGETENRFSEEAPAGSAMLVLAVFKW